MEQKDINQYIDESFEKLVKAGLIKLDSDRYSKEKAEFEEAKEYLSKTNMTYEDKIKVIDDRLTTITSQLTAIEKYGENCEDNAKMYKLVTIDSEITGKQETISACSLSKNAIHLHDGTPQEEVLNDKGESVSYLKKLLADARKFYGENEETKKEEKEQIKELVYKERIKPLVYQTIKECGKIMEEFPHLKEVRLDTNSGYFNLVYPALEKIGFENITNTNRFQEELNYSFPQGDIPSNRQNAASIGREKLLEYIRQRETSIDAQNFNYHTHTSLCGHAEGSIEEYIEKAIEGGIKQLGFSDHTPRVIGNSDPKHEMSMEQFTKDYIDELKKIKKERKDIDIKIGLEAEYYGDFGEQDPRVKSFREKTEPSLDYMILGQHTALERDDNGNIILPGFSRGNNAYAKYPIDYALTVVEAIKSGKFAYVAHPDIFLEERDDVPELEREEFFANAKKATEMICSVAKEYDIPLEVNLGNISAVEFGDKSKTKDGSYAYPVPEFWKVAQEKGCKCLIGMDAHSPEALKEKTSEKIAKNMLKGKGINLDYMKDFEPKGIGREGKGHEKVQEQKGIDVLKSGIEATEHSTRTGEIQYQTKTINEVHKDRQMGEQSHEKTRSYSNNSNVQK